MSPFGTLALAAAVLVALGASLVAWGIFAFAAAFELVLKPVGKAAIQAAAVAQESPEE